MGALALVVVCGRTCGSNVSLLLITIFVGLMNGLICMSEVFISVCCASNSKLMIKLLGGSTLMEPNDYMGVC